MNAERHRVLRMVSGTAPGDAVLRGPGDAREQPGAAATSAPIWRRVSAAPGDGAVQTQPWVRDATWIDSGTLVFECRFRDGWEGHKTLLSHRDDHDRAHDVAVFADASGGMFIAQRQGTTSLYAEAKLPGGWDGGAIMVQYHWNVGAQFWSLSIEDVLTGATALARGPGAMAFSVQSLDAMIADGAGADVAGAGDGAVVWAAVAEGRVPFGPAPTLAAETLILTPAGYCEAGHLRVGDIVETRDSGWQPIVWMETAQIPGRGEYVPAVIRTNYLGAQRDLRVLPRQRILVSGAEVEYLFGEEEVLVEARYFVQDRMAVLAPSGGLLRQTGLLFAKPELICANGCWVESLWLGELASDPDRLAASALAGDAGTMPLHRQTARRVLADYEARTLAALRSQNGVHR